MRPYIKGPLSVILMAVSLALSLKAGAIRADTGTREAGDTGAWAVTRVGNELQIAYGSGANLPQYGVLHLDSGYFRLNYGPASGWGTSVVLPPAFWSEGSYHQGTPLAATWQTAGPNLLLSMTGSMSSLQLDIQVELPPPAQGSLTAQVSTSVTGSLPLDDRPGEAFKLIMLSSMHIASDIWDSQAAFTGCQAFPLPADGWVIQPQPPLQAQSFGLTGGTSTWKTNAPTTWIILDQPRQIAGWVTPSADPNDDNVGLWAAADTILPSWGYRVVATAGTNLDCTFLPLTRR